MSGPGEPSIADTLEMFAHLGAEEDSAVYLRPCATEEAIASMQAAAHRDLGAAVPDAYVVLLRMTNGVQINGTYFKEAETLVPENLDMADGSVIVLGNQGNIADLVFDRGDRRFHIVAMGAPNERLMSFDGFEQMLLAVMRSERVL